MKTLPVLCLAALAVTFAPSVLQACACSETAAVAVPVSEKDAPARHPLKGVVVDVLADKSALLVKHEEIPGVMKAMTMLLKVDEAALKAVKKNDAITGQLTRKSDGWWLEAVSVVAGE
jgi:Cu/Ag efflux protein CusF